MLRIYFVHVVRALPYEESFRECTNTRARCARRKYLVNDTVWVNASRHISLFQCQTHLRREDINCDQRVHVKQLFSELRAARIDTAP